MTEKKKKVTLGILVGIAVGIILIAMAAFVWVKYKGTDKTEVIIEETVGKTGTELIRYTINNLYANGAYMNISIDEDVSITMIFDKNGRAYAESPYTSGLFIEKAKSMMAEQDGSGEPYFSCIDDMTPLYTIEVMCDLVDNKKATIKDITDTVKEESNGSTYKAYEISVKGTEIWSLFNVVSEDYAKSQLKSMYNTENINDINVGDEFKITVSCEENEYKLSALSQVITSGTPYVCWLIPGCIEIGAWEMDSTVWNKDKDLSNYDSVKKEFSEVQDVLGSKLQEYVDSHPELQEAANKINAEATEKAESVAETTETTETTETESVAETTEAESE